MKRVLLAGEPWMSYTTHVKGLGSLHTSVYETGEKWLKAVLEKGGCQVDSLPDYLASEEFPFTVGEIKKYDRVIFSDIGANTLLLLVPTFTRSQKVPSRAKLIRGYILEGGSLIMVGSYLIFSGVDAKGKWYDTAVQEALPVEVLIVDDRTEHCEGVKSQVVREHGALPGIPEDWSEVLGYNRIIPREDAVVVVEVEGDPLVVFGSYGKGRSAVLTTDCAPHWIPPEFCEWEYYDKIWQGIADWLITKWYSVRHRIFAAPHCFYKRKVIADEGI